jgi:hypothetical protein
VFESILALRPYFHSLREIQGNVSLDIKLPLHWSYEDIVKPYSGVKTKIQDKNEKYTLLSLISTATFNGYEIVFACANDLIKTNKDEEEKQKLYQQKIKELQELFKKGSLDKLKDLNILELYGQEDTTSDGNLAEGNEQGPDGDSESQEQDD